MFADGQVLAATLHFAAKALFYFAAIRIVTTAIVASSLSAGDAREAELRWRLLYLDRWPAYVFTVAWLVYFGVAAFAAGSLWTPSAAAFLAGLVLVPVLWNKRFGRYDYAPSLAVYADVRRVYRRQIAWLTVASIAGMVLLFDAA
jgi:hypothetical protein